MPFLAYLRKDRRRPVNAGATVANFYSIEGCIQDIGRYTRHAVSCDPPQCGWPSTVTLKIPRAAIIRRVAAEQLISAIPGKSDRNGAPGQL